MFHISFQDTARWMGMHPARTTYWVGLGYVIGLADCQVENKESLFIKIIYFLSIDNIKQFNDVYVSEFTE